MTERAKAATMKTIVKNFRAWLVLGRVTAQGKTTLSEPNQC